MGTVDRVAAPVRATTVVRATIAGSGRLLGAVTRGLGIVTRRQSTVTRGPVVVARNLGVVACGLVVAHGPCIFTRRPVCARRLSIITLAAGVA
ncbi:hypothetical protein GV791_30480 [Nocardia cyriacigeorgica]|uniref:Uncharacterized protein n=1 Tax=Nocardia cyriacigeorgica TaxID=135487 RepID=A0A6P1CWH2_9NOCA|nr:hypothetical protein [Nocardia cyriacigeorgica]NEW36850.1 hypothetical protein [Nocardia cyriacigeorgica]